MTEMTATNGNGAKEIKVTCLDSAKMRFEGRKSPAKDAEIKAVMVGYFKADEEVQALQAKLDDAKLKRTAATAEVVAVRGMTRMATKTKGTGQIVSRGDSAWIAFATATGEAIDL